jgi:hypothetical protein
VAEQLEPGTHQLLHLGDAGLRDPVELGVRGVDPPAGGGDLHRAAVLPGLGQQPPGRGQASGGGLRLGGEFRDPGVGHDALDRADRERLGRRRTGPAGWTPADVTHRHAARLRRRVVEALNYGLVIRYEWRQGVASVRTFRRPYDPGRTSLGHSWLPINIQVGPDGERLFCSFSGFRPRLLPRHIAAAYPHRVVDHATIRSVPPLLMRMDAETLEPDARGGRGHLRYAEPMAMVVAGTSAESYVCTFSPESGLRMYDTDDLGRLLCHAESPQLMHWKDTHFRPDPAHLAFVSR